MKKLSLLLILVAVQYSLTAENKTIIIRNRTGSVLSVSAQDFQGKIHSAQLSCDADSISTNIPNAQLKISLDIPAKSWTELVTGRKFFQSILINKTPLAQTEVTEVNKYVASLIDKNNTITVYLHRNPSPESWGDWGKNYIKETIGSYLGQSSKAPTFPYELQFIKEHGTDVIKG